MSLPLSPPPVPRLDAHQHFWVYDSQDYPWISPGSPLERDWLPQDLQLAQDDVGMPGSIAVQARQSLAETSFLLDLADRFPRIRGVVGWADLRAADFPAQLRSFREHPKLVGLRHVVQDEPDPRFLLGPDFLHGMARLEEFGLVYDLLLYPHQLPAAIELVHRFPRQPFVLDHLAKPRIRERLFAPWEADFRELAQAPNVCCKLSGLVTEADHHSWGQADLAPYLQIAFEAFGPARLLFGSDWPVCLLAASYRQVLSVVEDFLQGHSPEVHDQIFGGNAARIYRV